MDCKEEMVDYRRMKMLAVGLLWRMLKLTIEKCGSVPKVVAAISHKKAAEDINRCQI